VKAQKLKAVIRKAGLLPLLENIRYITNSLGNYTGNKKFIAGNPGFIPPPSKAAYDAYTTVDYSSYFNSGRKEAEIISGFIDKFASGKKVLDFGCGSARILRHMDKNKYELTGSDYNEEAIEWCGKNLSGLKFILNGLTPPIDAKSDSYNFIYAISVLTHLSEEVQIQWLEELERVSSDNGVIMITLHGERHTSKLLPEELKRFRDGNSVIKGGVKEGSRIYTSYHSEKYAREKLFKGREIIYFTDQPLHKNFSQDVYILRVRK